MTRPPQFDRDGEEPAPQNLDAIVRPNNNHVIHP
jgi:hypothetical protein